MPGSSAGSTSIFRNCRGYFYLPLKADHPFSLFRERAIRPSGVVRRAKLDSQSPPRTKGLANKDGNGSVQQISASGSRENRTQGPTNSGDDEYGWRKAVLSEDQNDVEVNHAEREHQAETLTRPTAFEPRKSDVHSSDLCLDCSRDTELSKD